MKTGPPPRAKAIARFPPFVGRRSWIWSGCWTCFNGRATIHLYHSIANINVEVSPIAVNEQDPSNRIITKPILDGNSMVLGVAGMVVDETYFKGEVLPSLIEGSLQEFFPNDHGDMIITLQDVSGHRLFETQASEGKDFEVAEPLRLIFKDLSFKIVMRSYSLEQAAKRAVAVNLTLSVLMTGLLMAGIYMALRTTSREMKLSRMKSDFVSNVSHELRTPLASIRVFGEFFRLGWVKDSEKSREYGEYIENESRRLTLVPNRSRADRSDGRLSSRSWRLEERLAVERPVAFPFLR